MNLRELFMKPEKIRFEPDMIDELAGGMCKETGHAWDNQFSDDVTDHLFETNVTRDQGGMDLVALNIQRGRDHGIPGYTEYNNLCGGNVPKATTFDDLLDTIDREYVDKLKSVYNHVDDVDLFVGGFLERPPRPGGRDGILGKVFKCIVSNTFAELKFGDRFFYDLGQDSRRGRARSHGPGSSDGPPPYTYAHEHVTRTRRFTPEQLKEIRKVSMARVLCDNVEGLGELQPNVFYKANFANPSKSCRSNDIPRMNYQVFNGLPAQWK